MGTRTQKRPVAAGRMEPGRALEFGLTLSAFSFVLLASTVNVLTAAQHELSTAFARSGTDKYLGVSWTPTPQGAPALDGAAVHVEARVADCLDGGDHHIVTCVVEALSAVADHEPLVYYRCGYRALV